jgi:hypothetical protein
MDQPSVSPDLWRGRLQRFRTLIRRSLPFVSGMFAVPGTSPISKIFPEPDPLTVRR